jgi:hypothetical protein
MRRGRLGVTVLFFATVAMSIQARAQLSTGGAQAPSREATPAPATAQSAAPIDLTGYWVSLIVDEWRFRVTPQKGDILYLPLNPGARQLANAWDPEKDSAEGKQCKAYGAVGVMQRPGRLHITWQDANTLKIDTDAGTQMRLLHFGPVPSSKGQASWQGYSTANWQVMGRNLIDTGGTGFVPAGRQNRTSQSGMLKVLTTNMLPGYLRKNGVPYSGNAVLTESFNRLTGQQGDAYIALTATVEDPTYLTGPFIRSYTFKHVEDASGWDPTPCWTK